MQLQQLELVLPAERLDEADALLELLGASGLVHLPASNDEILEPEPGSAPSWKFTRIRALFAGSRDLSALSDLLRTQFGHDIEICIAGLPDSQWMGTLSIEPSEVRIGERLLITGSPHTTDTDRQVVVRLNRGLGFGTGEHATTRLCLEWLVAGLAGGQTVLDYGCGSGVLAIAALRLGASHAWAVDIEPQAIQATLANAELNGVRDRLWAGEPHALPIQRADIVLANILAGPLIALAPRFAALVASDGGVVLAGLLAAQAQKVSETYQRYFATLMRAERDGWVRIVATGVRR